MIKNAVEKSSCKKTKRTVKNRPKTAGAILNPDSFKTSCFFAKKFAKNKTTENFAISEGWKVPKTGTLIQRLAPFRSTPIKGKKVNTHKIIVPKKITGNNFLTKDKSIMENKISKNKPIPALINCLLTKYKESLNAFTA